MGLAYNVTAANVIGRIGIDPLTGKAESDFYQFDATAGTVLNVDVFSASLSRSRIINPIDSIVRVYLIDPQTGQRTLAPYYSTPTNPRVAVNDNGFQGLDSSLLDLILPSHGQYLVEVDSYSPPGGDDQDTGDYELFLYTFARGGKGVLPGDSLFGGSGNDTTIGDTSGGFVNGNPNTDVNLPGSGSTKYLDNVPPQFAKSGDNRTVTQKTLLTLDGSFFEADDLDLGLHTYLWTVTSDNGEVITEGTDPSFQFSPGKPGIYTVTFTVSDGKDSATSTTVITVTNVAPVFTPPATKPVLSEGVQSLVPLGSFTDPGNGDGPWTVVVAWGDGKVETFTVDQPGTLGSRLHTYASNQPGNVDYQVTVTVTDVHSAAPGPDGKKNFAVSVPNLAPVVNAGGDQTFLAPGTVLRTGSFVDAPGDGPWTATVNYGDGTGVQDISSTIDQALRIFILAHIYAQLCVFQVIVKVTDVEQAESMGAGFKVTATSPLNVVEVGPLARYGKTSVPVHFSAPITPSTFMAEDLVLTRNGVPLALTGASIAPVAGQPTRYTVQLGALATTDGEYVLSVNAATILNLDGFNGTGTAQVVWTTDRTLPTSRVVPFSPQRQTSPAFPVTLSFADTGSGVGSYDLYVSINNKAFTLVPGLVNVPLEPGQTTDTQRYS